MGERKSCVETLTLVKLSGIGSTLYIESKKERRHERVNR